MENFVTSASHCRDVNMVIATTASSASVRRGGTACSVQSQFAVLTVMLPEDTVNTLTNVGAGWAGQGRHARTVRYCQAVNMATAPSHWSAAASLAGQAYCVSQQFVLRDAIVKKVTAASLASADAR